MKLLCIHLVLIISGWCLYAEDKPNIILILADDMGVGEVSHNGGIIPTPALDQMAAEGMRFTDAHTTSSVCTPTRYGILTGRYNWRSRLKSGVLVNVHSDSLMDPEAPQPGKFLCKTPAITPPVLGSGISVPTGNYCRPGRPHRPVRMERRKGALQKFGSWLVDYTKPFRNGPGRHGI